jgi:sulfate transport system ATP-binding protein
LYDHPVNDFVMGFLGPVTELNRQLVRPHDIEVLRADLTGSVQAKVHRLVRIGFEVRAELDAGDSQPWVQLTRGQADALELQTGSVVWLRPSRDASTLVAEAGRPAAAAPGRTTVGR